MWCGGYLYKVDGVYESSAQVNGLEQQRIALLQHLMVRQLCVCVWERKYLFVCSVMFLLCVCVCARENTPYTHTHTHTHTTEARKNRKKKRTLTLPITHTYKQGWTSSWWYDLGVGGGVP